MKTTSALILALSCLILTACATGGDGYQMGSEPTEASYSKNHAAPAAYGADGFTFNKRQPTHAANDSQFFNKKCALNDKSTYYSKTSYYCDSPWD